MYINCVFIWVRNNIGAYITLCVASCVLRGTGFSLVLHLLWDTVLFCSVPHTSTTNTVFVCLCLICLFVDFLTLCLTLFEGPADISRPGGGCQHHKDCRYVCLLCMLCAVLCYHMLRGTCLTTRIRCVAVSFVCSCWSQACLHTRIHSISTGSSMRHRSTLFFQTLLHTCMPCEYTDLSFVCPCSNACRRCSKT